MPQMPIEEIADKAQHLAKSLRIHESQIPNKEYIIANSAVLSAHLTTHLIASVDRMNKTTTRLMLVQIGLAVAMGSLAIVGLLAQLGCFA